MECIDRMEDSIPVQQHLFPAIVTRGRGLVAWGAAQFDGRVVPFGRSRRSSSLEYALKTWRNRLPVYVLPHWARGPAGIASTIVVATVAANRGAVVSASGTGTGCSRPQTHS